VSDFTTIDVVGAGSRGALTLNRPDKLNPLSSTTLAEIAEAARWFDRHPAIKVVVVSGNGRSFSAGADLGAFDPAGPATAADRSPRENADLGRLMADAVEAMSAVTVARIHGHCIGGGVVLAAACDLRVAASDAYFSIPEVDLGIPLAWGGIPRLVREIGPAMTRELVLTCRPFGPDEAKAIGFVNRVVPRSELESAVDQLAEQLARKAPSVVRATKRQVNEALEDMAPTVGAWSDTDLLGAAMRDPEARAAARDYLAARQR
jgi:enoyl-CoA hydratase/carnithine racemase